MRLRIVLSALILFILACGAQESTHGGIGTSPSLDDQPAELDAVHADGGIDASK